MLNNNDLNDPSKYSDKDGDGVPDVAENQIDSVPEDSKEYYESHSKKKKGIWQTAKQIIAGRNNVGKVIGFGLDTLTFFAPHGSKIDKLRQKGKQALNLNEQKFNYQSNNNDMDWLVNRLKEKSTWRGIVAFLTAVGVGWSPDQKEAVVMLGIAVAGAFEVFFKEPQSKDAKVK